MTLLARHCWLCAPFWYTATTICLPEGSTCAYASRFSTSITIHHIHDINVTASLSGVRRLTPPLTCAWCAYTVSPNNATPPSPVEHRLGLTAERRNPRTRLAILDIFLCDKSWIRDDTFILLYDADTNDGGMRTSAVDALSVVLAHSLRRFCGCVPVDILCHRGPPCLSTVPPPAVP